MMRRTDVVVLGAGLQGTGVALELARRGIRVALIEREARPLNRASLRNEGKIHLGLIYANDPSRETAFLQLKGALRFRQIVARWIDRHLDWLSCSTPFHYLVARDSLLSPDSLVDHYTAVEDQCRRELEDDADLDYLGTRPHHLVRRLSDAQIGEHYETALCAAGFATAELAIETDRLAACLRAALIASPNVSLMASHMAREVVEEPGGFRVEGDAPEGPWAICADQIVNATWERRLALDLQIGLRPPVNLVHRLKFRMIARLPPGLQGAPSASIVLGPYGDVIVRGDGTACLSWYPVGLRGWSHDIEPPTEWDAACRGDVPPDLVRDIGGRMLESLDAWCPGIGQCQPILVDAGVIVALGRTDVDDRSSALHTRSCIGVVSRGGYHTVDTGKLTTAPLFAAEAANRVEIVRSGYASAV